MSKVKIYTLSDPRSPNNIRYVGKTVASLKKRLDMHLAARNKYKHHCANWIRNLYDAHGLRPIILILDYATEDTWKDTERYWIAQFRAWGFDLTNNTAGGDDVSKDMIEAGKKTRFEKGAIPWNKGLSGFGNFNKGLVRSQETKNKISESKIGSTPWNKGVKTGQEVWNKGIGWNEEMRQKLHDVNPHKKKVAQYTKEGLLIATFDSMRLAGEQTGIDYRNISKRANGKINWLVGGFDWKFVGSDN